MRLALPRCTGPITTPQKRLVKIRTKRFRGNVMDAATWVGLRQARSQRCTRITMLSSRFWQATVMADYYETLAADYDWIFDDDTLGRGLAINHPGTARLLERTSHGSTVLDAACGTGINAAALARRGYRVWAADGSRR